MHRLYLILFFLAAVFSCRDGHFENQALFSKSSRLKIDLRSSRLHQTATDKEDATKLAFNIEAHLKFYGLVEQSPVASHLFHVQIQSVHKTKLFDSSLTTDKDGEMKIVFTYTLPAEEMKDPLKVLISFHSDFYSDFSMEAYLDLSNESNPVSQIQMIKNSEKFFSEKIAARKLDCQLVSSTVNERDATSTTTEQVQMTIQLKVLDAYSQIPLANRKVALHYKDYVYGSSDKLQLETDDSGILNIPLQLPYSPHENDYRQRLDLSLQLPSKNYPDALQLVVIENLSGTQDSPVISLFPLSQIYQHSEWINRARIFASEEPQRLNIEDVFLSGPIYLPHSDEANYNLEMKVSLYRYDFSGQRLISMSNVTIDAKLVAIQSSDDHLWIEKTFGSLQDFQIKTTATARFKVNYSLSSENIFFNQNSWLFLELSIPSLERIPPAYFFISPLTSDILQLEDKPQIDLEKLKENKDAQ